MLAATLAALALLSTGTAWMIGTARADIPAPTGLHPVGRTDTALTAGGRTIPVSIWYPTTRSGTAPYIPASNPIARARLAAEAAVWLHTPLATPAMAGAVLPIAEDAPATGDRLPVVLWSPGMGTPRWLASGLMMTLASRGYVVVAMDHTGESPAVEIAGLVEVGAPPTPGDVRYMRQALDARVADARLILDRLTELPIVGPYLDLERVAMAGHSYGGQTAVSVMAVDARIRTVVVLDGSAGWDGVAAPTVDRPVLLLASGDMIHASWTRTGATIATLAGAGHYTATDLPRFGGTIAYCGTIDAELGTTVTREVVVAWISRHLREQGTAMPEHPELRWR